MLQYAPPYAFFIFMHSLFNILTNVRIDVRSAYRAAGILTRVVETKSLLEELSGKRSEATVAIGAGRI